MHILLNTFFSNPSDLTVGAFSNSSIKYPFPESPLNFLDYAEAELIAAQPAKLANALAHAERALASQLDFFFICYGLSGYAKINKWGNGKKIALLADLGVIPGRILHKVNEARNKLEHRYELPTSVESTTNAVDVVNIFLSVTDMYLFPSREEVQFYSKSSSKSSKPFDALLGKTENNILIALGKNEGEIRVQGNANGVAIDESVDVTSSPSDFFFLLTFVLNYHRLELPNPNNYFSKLRYIAQLTNDGGLTSRSS